MNPTSLYCCLSCGRVVRYDSGHAALGCLCDALPLSSDRTREDFFAHRYGCEGGRIGPPRPYYQDREHTMVEFEDDGREGVEDLRDGYWYG